jgi:hypothetical protein
MGSLENIYYRGEFCVERIINNKQVFIEEEHHQVLRHWIGYRRDTSDIPFVITLDHHTDTRTAFHGLACRGMKHNTSNIIEFRESIFNSVHLDNLDFINNLCNDEHINFATRKNIVSRVYISSFQTSYNGSQDSYNESVYHINSFCHSHCLKNIHDDDCTLIRYDKCIESEELVRQILHVSEMHTDNYILDIDLDFFHTMRSIEPNDPSIFHRLIRGAAIITVATEPFYVNSLKIDQEINSEYLLQRLLVHIDQATSENQ